MSPQVQNRGVSGPPKRTYLLHNHFHIMYYPLQKKKKSVGQGTTWLAIIISWMYQKGRCIPKLKAEWLIYCPNDLIMVMYSCEMACQELSPFSYPLKFKLHIAFTKRNCTGLGPERLWHNPKLSTMGKNNKWKKLRLLDVGTLQIIDYGNLCSKYSHCSVQLRQSYLRVFAVCNRAGSIRPSALRVEHA